MRTTPATGTTHATGSSWAASKKMVRELVLSEVASKSSGLSAEALAVEVRSALDGILQREDVKVSPRERRAFLQEVIQDTLGYGPLDHLLADVSVTEVMCNAYDDIWVERNGKLSHTGAQFTDDNQYRHVIEKIVAAVGRRVDEGSPMVDARLPDGSRVNAVIPPLAIHGPVLTIRKFAADPYQVKDLINFGTLTLDLATVMEACVRRSLCEGPRDGHSGPPRAGSLGGMAAMNLTVLAVTGTLVGLALLAGGILWRAREREQALAQILDLPYGERDVEVTTVTEGYSPLVKGTIGLAGRIVDQIDQIDQKGTMASALERGRIPVKPGEYAVISGTGTIALAPWT